MALASQFDLAPIEVKIRRVMLTEKRASLPLVGRRKVAFGFYIALIGQLREHRYGH